MGIIRLIHHRHYDPDRKQFKSLAFKPSSDGSGISVIDTDCILRKNSTVCEHIQRFYQKVAGAPAIFWDIPLQSLPEDHRLNQANSDAGDDCHYNLVGLTETEAKNIFKKVPISDFKICTDTGEFRPLSESDLDNF